MTEQEVLALPVCVARGRGERKIKLTPQRTIPDKLKRWLAQPGCVLTNDEAAFLFAVQDFAARGVGYGWMQQVIEWEWQEACIKAGLPGGSWGPEYFAAEKEKTVVAEREACATLAESAQRHHDNRCPADCKCADGFHIALAIRTRGK